MKKNKLYQRALLGVAIANCFLLLSCANQNVDEGAQLDGAEQTVSDSAGGADGAPASGDDVASLGAEGGDQAAAPPAGDNGGASSDLSNLDAAMSDGAKPGEAQATPPAGDATPAPAAGGDLAATTGNKTGADEDLDKAMAEPGAGTPPPAAAANATPPAGATSAAGADKLTASNEPPPADPAAPPPANPAVGTGAELAPPADAAANPVADAAAASEAAASLPRSAGHSPKLPKVRSQAFHKGSVTLNRFYFVRKGDNAGNVSELIYGNGERAGDLKKWNKGSWKPGKLVYYQSPNAPEDTAMKSLYEERNLTPEQYQVQPGDWISRIAKAKLGDARSWKEIAVINGLSGTAISKGQQLAIYTDLKGGSAPAAQPPQEQANAGAPANQAMPNGNPNQPAPGQPGAVPPPGAEPMVAQGAQHGAQPPGQPLGGDVPPGANPMDPNGVNQAAMPTPPPIEPAPTAKRKPHDSGVNIGKLLQQNAFFLVMGLGISGLLLALLAINKRKRAARSDEFNEDSFGATAVRKRR